MRPLIALVLIAAVPACGPPAPSCTGVCVAPALTTLALVAGQPGGPGSVDGSGAAVHFADPWTFAGDGAGKLYVIDGSIIRAVDETTGTVTTLAGSYGGVGGVDGVGPAAQFFQPGGMALAGGTLYVCDTENHAIRAIDPSTAAVTTFAGALTQGGFNDGDAASARFREPEGLVSDGAGNLYVADTDNNTIRRIALATGAVTTLAGTAGVAGNADGLGPAASFSKPKMLAADGGHVYVVDSGNASIRSIALADGSVTTRATFALTPVGVAVDGPDLLATLADHRIARIDAAGGVTTLAGAANASGFADGAAADARFFRPAGLWVESGRVLVADDGNYAVRSVALADGATTTLYGAVSAGASDGSGADARFFVPQGLAVDGASAYLADTDNHTIRRVDLQSGAVTTIAGAVGQASYADGSGADARFNTPIGVALDDGGHRLYVVDSGNRSIRAVELASGAVTTLPTNGAPGSMFARFNSPAGLARDGALLYVSDSADHVIVAVDLATNLVTHVAGSPRVAGASDGDSTKARFNAPAGLAADGRGALYVADVLNDAVRKIDLKSGTVTTVAGVLGIRGADDGAATSAHFNAPNALAVDGLGHLFVADQLNALVRRVDTSPGQVTTVVGTVGLPGVRLGALPAQLGAPTALALTPEGHLLIVAENALLVAR
ncbi:MAG: Serine/threonine-protein kinase PknD [bacterium]|nr:Serine/threonine-protein kinase PknD [bacterium]